MYELDRILDRDEMARAGPIHQIDQACEGGRLARTGRTGDQNQSLIQVGQRLDFRT